MSNATALMPRVRVKRKGGSDPIGCRIAIGIGIDVAIGIGAGTGAGIDTGVVVKPFILILTYRMPLRLKLWTLIQDRA
jgi:hypothetical protein